MLLQMLQDTKSHSLAGFLVQRLLAGCRPHSPRTSARRPSSRRRQPSNVHGEAAETLYQGDPVDEDHGAAHELPLAHRREGDPRTASTSRSKASSTPRSPGRRRSTAAIPFVIEAGLAFGKGPDQARRRAADSRRCRWPKAKSERTTASSPASSATPTACRSSISSPPARPSRPCSTPTWRNYGIAQSRGALPAGPMVVFVHMASVWVPFTSESKEAIADYDEIRKEIKLALQECGRRLGVFLRRRERAKGEFRRRNIFELYIEEVVEACARLKGGRLPKESSRTSSRRSPSSGPAARGPTRSSARERARKASPTPSSSPPRAPRARRRSCRRRGCR